MKSPFCILVTLLLMANLACAQTDSAVVITGADTANTKKAKTEKVHNPKIAIALSAVLPGAGQVYNRKAWKVPIVYAGLGAATYCVYHFATMTNMYKFEYRYRKNGETDKLDPDLSTLSDETVLSEKNYYRRFMEISIAALAIVYMLNIVDAAVDAHLYYFDISDNLALSVQPFARNYALPFAGINHGVTLSLRF